MYDYEITVDKCPSCHMNIEPGEDHCKAGHPIRRTPKNLATANLPEINKYIIAYGNLAKEHPESKLANAQMGMCYVKLKQYDKALAFLDKATDDNWEDDGAWFMTAVCLLRGKKPFVAQRADINKAIDCLNTAIQINPAPMYYLLLGYIKQDYFERKFLSISPSADEDYDKADELGVTDEDKAALEALLMA